jgi:hypothetical protein
MMIQLANSTKKYVAIVSLVILSLPTICSDIDIAKKILCDKREDIIQKYENLEGTISRKLDTNGGLITIHLKEDKTEFKRHYPLSFSIIEMAFLTPNHTESMKAVFNRVKEIFRNTITLLCADRERFVSEKNNILEKMKNKALTFNEYIITIDEAKSEYRELQEEDLAVGDKSLVKPLTNYLYYYRELYKLNFTVLSFLIDYLQPELAHPTDLAINIYSFLDAPRSGSFTHINSELEPHIITDILIPQPIQNLLEYKEKLERRLAEILRKNQNFLESLQEFYDLAQNIEIEHEDITPMFQIIADLFTNLESAVLSFPRKKPFTESDKINVKERFSEKITLYQLRFKKRLEACQTLKSRFVDNIVPRVKEAMESGDFLALKHIEMNYLVWYKEYGEGSNIDLRDIKRDYSKEIKQFEKSQEIYDAISSIGQNVPKIRSHTLNSNTLDFIKNNIFWLPEFQKLQLVAESLLVKAPKESPFTTSFLVPEIEIKTASYETMQKQFNPPQSQLIEKFLPPEIKKILPQQNPVVIKRNKNLFIQFFQNYKYLIGGSMLGAIILGATIYYKKYRKNNV